MSAGTWEWKAPIDYGSVVFDGAGLFPNAGTFYHDASSRKNNGTLVNNPNWQWEPKLGRWGIRYDRASSQGVTATGNNLPSLGNAWTLAFWTAPTVVNIQFMRCVSISDGTRNLQIVTGGTQRDIFYVRNSTLTGPVAPVSNFTTVNEIDVLRHRALVFNGEYSAFTDGVIDTGSVMSDTYGGYNTLGIYQGFRGDALGHYHGLITGLLFFNTALSSTQIAWLANPANNPWQLFAPAPSRFYLIPTAPALTAPTLSSATAINITSSGFQPRVTATY